MSDTIAAEDDRLVHEAVQRFLPLLAERCTRERLGAAAKIEGS